MLVELSVHERGTSGNLADLITRNFEQLKPVAAPCRAHWQPNPDTGGGHHGA